MKQFLVVLSLLASLSACSSKSEQNTKVESSDNALNSTSVSQTTPEADNSSLAKIEIAETVHDFGQVKEGAVVEHTFLVKNTGAAPLIIKETRASCGCTVPEKPEQPIAPGATGEIKVKFNTAGKPGAQSKVVTIVANTSPEISEVTLRGFVEGDDLKNLNGPVKQ